MDEVSVTVHGIMCGNEHSDVLMFRRGLNSFSGHIEEQIGC